MSQLIWCLAPGVAKPRQRCLKEQVVVVTGASSGIGRLACLKFAEHGAKVVATSRDKAGLESLVHEIKDKGGHATFVVADISIFEHAQAIADYAFKMYGRIDTWINNAGVFLVAPIEKTTSDEYSRVMEINYLGSVNGTLAALPFLKLSGGGTIIFTTSVAARIPVSWTAAYSASKFAIDGFIGCLRIQLMNEKVPISVTNIMPYSIDTPLFDSALSRTGFKPASACPFYSPESVVCEMLKASIFPVRECVVGTAGKLCLFLKWISPGFLFDWVSSRDYVMKTTLSKSLKGEGECNLYEPSKDQRIYGGFGGTQSYF